ncbi:MAG: AIPR family protein [Opitutaceae bacterium]|jgi:hypothetical protein
MAKNDIVLVDGIVQQRQSESLPSDQQDEVFEYLVIEQLLKDYDLAQEEIESGWIDGNGDGGIDGFYTLINGHFIDDESTFQWPKIGAAIDIWLITCKHHASFQQATLDALIATIEEIFDFGIEECKLEGKYSEELLNARRLLITAYRRLSTGRPNINISVVYGSRGDSAKVGESVQARANQIVSSLSEYFSSSRVKFLFFGSSEIVESHRRIKTFELDLPFIEHLATGKESYVLLVKLADYWEFVTDEKQNLRRYLFDSNVRDYLGDSGVNEDISLSLSDPIAPDFWWLNNGVTILTTSAPVTGKTIRLKDIQIVNGLQTTATIFKHFTSGSKISLDRSVLVKVIVTSSPSARDRIIRATNNQNPVEVAALRATDKIQRDIEDILEKNDWFYERHRNYYKNLGKPATRFVTPAYIASGVVALIHKNAHEATRIKTKFMRDQVAYDDVFSSDLSIEIWPKIVDVYKRIDTALGQLVKVQKRREKVISSWRPLLALLMVARFFRTYDYSSMQFIGFNINSISDIEFEEAVAVIHEANTDIAAHTKNGYVRVNKTCELMASRFGISGLEVVGKRKIKRSSHTILVRSNPRPASERPSVAQELIDAVDAQLPEQPWKPRVHVDVANKLGQPAKDVSAAIQALIILGRRYQQKDGIVYSKDGSIIAKDPER